MTDKLLEHTKKSASALNVLFEGDHIEAGLMLLYAWVDRMAWLSTDKKGSNGQDFKDWVNRYLMHQYKYPFNADDLWAARCAVLHTGTNEARDTHKGKAKKLLYYTGVTHSIKSKQDDTVFVSIHDLHVGFIGAIREFATYLSGDNQAKETAYEKLEKLLSSTEVA